MANSYGRVALGNLTNMPSRQSMLQPKKSFGGNESRISLAPNADPRKSLASQSRPSTAPRSSSFYGKSKSTSKTDPRPLNDKKFIGVFGFVYDVIVKDLVRKLMQFLTTNGYPQQISANTLLHPMQKDFYGIFEFLVQKIDPTFQLTNNMEDTMTVFKALRYPFAISKSALTTIGTPHTWPMLLASLVWLVELVQYNETLGVEKGDQFGDESARMKKLLMEHTQRAYAEYLRGQDSTEEWDRDVQDIFAEEQRKLKKQMIDYDEKMVTFNSERETLEVSVLEQALNRCQTLESDVNKYMAWFKQIEEALPGLEARHQEHLQQITALEIELSNTIEEKRRYQHIVSTQELNTNDVEKLLKETNQLQETLNNLSNLKQSLEQVAYEKEIQIAKRLEEIEKQVTQLNSTLRRLKMIPQSAKNANNSEFQISFDSKNPEACYEAVKNIIKPALDTLKLNFYKEAIQSKEELINVKEKAEKCEEMVQDKRDELATKESALHQFDAAYKREKQILKEKWHQKQQEVESVKRDTNNIKEGINQLLNQSHADVESYKKQQEELQIAYEDEKKEVLAFLTDTMDKVLAHRHYMTENIKAMESIFNLKLKSIPKPVSEMISM